MQQNNITTTNSQKALAFLIDCPVKGKAMLFPGFYESQPADTFEDMEEVDKKELDAYNITFCKTLLDTPYKVFRTKTKSKKNK